MESNDQILHALRNKYSPETGEYAFLEQVGKDVSATYNRWADAIAVGLWKSRGHQIIGFEIKRNRSDWLKEKRDPHKAHGVGKYCHKWYLVVGDETIVKSEELPMNWGLMVPHTKNTLRIKKEAILIKDPEPATMGFICAILRRSIQQCLPENRLQREYRRGIKEGTEQGENWNKRTLEHRENRINDLEKKIEDFEKEAGFQITEGWNKPDIVGKAVKMVVDGTYPRYIRKLEDLKDTLNRLSNNVKDELKIHRQLERK